MSQVFLDQYSLTGCLAFEGYYSHHKTFYAEKEWNGYAIIHFTLTLLYWIPGIAQALYAVEAFASSFFKPTDLFDLSGIEPHEGTLLRFANSSDIKLQKGIILGTLNQYDPARNDSCTVQAMAFLETLFQKQSIDAESIDQSIERGFQAFTELTRKAYERRRENTRDFLLKQGVAKRAIEAFFHANPHEPKMLALMQFAEENYLDEFERQIFYQNLSGQALTAEEAKQAFKDHMTFQRDFTRPLAREEIDRQTYFRDTFISDLEKSSNPLSGAVMTCNGTTRSFAIHKREEGTIYVIYDSHGNPAKHDGNSASPQVYYSSLCLARWRHAESGSFLYSPPF